MIHHHFSSLKVYGKLPQSMMDGHKISRTLSVYSDLIYIRITSRIWLRFVVKLLSEHVVVNRHFSSLNVYG